MKTISEIFLEVFNEGLYPGDEFLSVITEEEIEDIVTTGMDYDCFKLIVKKYAEQAIERCANTAYDAADKKGRVGYYEATDFIDMTAILKVKEELK